MTDAGDRITTIFARPLVLRRAISNLIVNAIKYGGGAAVGVAVHASLVRIHKGLFFSGKARRGGMGGGANRPAVRALVVDISKRIALRATLVRLM